MCWWVLDALPLGAHEFFANFLIDCALSFLNKHTTKKQSKSVLHWLSLEKLMLRWFKPTDLVTLKYMVVGAHEFFANFLMACAVLLEHYRISLEKVVKFHSCIIRC